MAVLTSKKRKALGKETFVFPSIRAFPLPDEEHGRNALSRAPQATSVAKKLGIPISNVVSRVKAAVSKKFPNIEVSARRGGFFHPMRSRLRAGGTVAKKGTKGSIVPIGEKRVDISLSKAERDRLRNKLQIIEKFRGGGFTTVENKLLRSIDFQGGGIVNSQGLKKPEAADLNKDKKISGFERKRAEAIDKSQVIQGKARGRFFKKPFQKGGKAVVGKPITDKKIRELTPSELELIRKIREADEKVRRRIDKQMSAKKALKRADLEKIRKSPLKRVPII